MSAFSQFSRARSTKLGSLGELVEPPVRLAQSGVGQRVAGVLLEGSLEKADGGLDVFRLLEAEEVSAGAEVVGVGSAGGDVSLPEPAELALSEREPRA